MEIPGDILEKLERLLMEKSFADLDETEREIVSRYIGDESDYEGMREASRLMERRSKVVAPEAVLREVKRKLHEQPPRSRTLAKIFTAKVPVYYVYAASVVAILFLVVRGTTKLPSPVRQVVRVTDTVYVASRPDTVFVDRVIYKSVPARQPAPSVSVARTGEPQQMPAGQGINMEERQDLETFLVSGSR